MFKLSRGSSFNSQGPPDDQDEEAELSVTEMKQLREKQLKEVEVLKQAELQALEQKAEKEKEAMEDTGCSWGMGKCTGNKM